MRPKVRDERAKLTATYLNNLAVALFAVGVLAPTLAALYGTGGPPAAVAAGNAICAATSLALRLIARRTLASLEG